MNLIRRCFLIYVFTLAASNPVSAQRLERAGASSPGYAVTNSGSGRHQTDEPRPPLPRGAVPMQILSGGAGGLAGAFVAFVPFALAAFNGKGMSDDAGIAAVLIGYYGGTVAGVHAYGRAIGLKGSWRATFLGAAVGILGGPAVLFTMPIGATIGFNSTREAR